MTLEVAVGLLLVIAGSLAALRDPVFVSGVLVTVVLTGGLLLVQVRSGGSDAEVLEELRRIARGDSRAPTA